MLPEADRILVAALIITQAIREHATNEEAAAMGEERPFTVDSGPSPLMRVAMEQLRES
jgi:hypothetical protein